MSSDAGGCYMAHNYDNDWLCWLIMHASVIWSNAGGGDATASLTDGLTRDIGTELYSAPEQLSNTQHSMKVL